MKQTSVIVLLTLLLLPIIWNGVTLFHFVVEHTHTFCEEDLTHTHSDTEDCLSIFQLTENHTNNQLPSSTKSEFKELKQYLNPDTDLTSITAHLSQQMAFFDILLSDNSFSKDIFQPPVLA